MRNSHINTHSVDTVVQSVQAEQRKHVRRSVNFHVRVLWQGESLELKDEPGLVRDISASGFGIEMTRSLPEGKLLSVETQAGSLQGIVRHVRPLPVGFLLGMEVLSASDGSNHQRSLRNLEVAVREASESR